MSKDREFLWRRLHSLLGVIPVGLFLMFHLSMNFTAVGGEQAYNNAIGKMDLIPHNLLLVIEWVVIYIPLLFHAFYGVFIAFTASPNTGRFSTYRNWMFSLQRFTGVFLVIFIAWHIFQTRIQKALGSEVEYNMIADIVSNPFMLGFYIVGIISATFHLSNGLWAFLVSWGITQSPQSQKVATYVTNIIFVILSVVGVAAILAFV
ncbi:succinate dehydrogenase [Lysinibacillus sphaericus]|uniref:Succinate dehydrogenase cytochrome b558 subunit n=1 Tax=Lysinibacillus zambalensis TaxID=3160866 RepID=A0ABV1MQ16_9BACI|nr:succinate dehydrogenase cytochrome b558 subunit [Lysinibacillus sphaericus]MBG9453530.1 succinate dehydrogenase [Lysinibacillus sphaericus]MBG9480327.1 succinate dehydrogenase [Lysinibacillus sphaericus]MBG9595006.1 succinate dehydrogenase [Lysinibacillus sphaericus]